MDTPIKTEATPPEAEEAFCLTRSVARAFDEDPTIEAITIDRTRKTVSVATLGRTDVPKITERICTTIERVQKSRAPGNCTLLKGRGQCDTCAQPLSELQRQKITIR